MPKRYIRGDKVISNTTPPPVLLVLRRKPPTPLDSYSPQGAGRRQYRQKMPRWCSAIERPNITGTITHGNRDNEFKATGCFFNADKIDYWAPDMQRDGLLLKFNATVGNPLYGKSSTVQPAALQTLIIIKIWKALGWIVLEEPYLESDFWASNITVPCRSPVTWPNPAYPFDGST